MFTIRKAEQADADVIGLLITQSWQTAYRGLLCDEYLDQLCAAQTAHRVAQLIGEGEMEIGLGLLGNTGAGSVGFCHARDLEMGGWGEIASLYLLPEYWSHGYGKLLLQYAFVKLSEQGMRRCYLWVLESNSRARRFYEKAGFILDHGTRTDTFDTQQIVQVRYILPSIPAAVQHF